MKWGILLLCCLTASGCSPHAEAKDAVQDVLNDPESAEFVDVASDGRVTCGSVNAKNRFGGYVGYRPFIVQEGNAEIGEPLDTDFSQRFFDLCPYESGERFRREISTGLQAATDDLEDALK